MALFLRLFRDAGVATPWKAIYILAEYKGYRGLLRHEICHIRQIQRDGQLKFWSRYCWWLITVGYAANPYEIEVYYREVQFHHFRRLLPMADPPMSPPITKVAPNGSHMPH